MIITAQPFFNELDLLEIKCRELQGVVDLHLVVEADRTFTGLPKPLYFAENKDRFRDFPVMHVAVELPASIPSPWDRERVQHEHIRRIVGELHPEIVIHCDTDEIPRKDTVERFRAMRKLAMHVDMDWVTFFFDRLDTSRRPTTARICFHDPSDGWGPWRGDNLDKNPATVLPDGGWHFDYFNFGGEFLVSKLKAISHAADEGGDSMLKSVLAGQLPGIERTVPYDVAKLPEFVRLNRERFAANFSQP